MRLILETWRYIKFSKDRFHLDIKQFWTSDLPQRCESLCRFHCMWVIRPQKKIKWNFSQDCSEKWLEIYKNALTKHDMATSKIPLSTKTKYGLRHHFKWERIMNGHLIVLQKWWSTDGQALTYSITCVDTNVTVIMIKSSNGNIFRVTGPLWEEFTHHRWIPLTKASDAELWYFLWFAPEQIIQ